VICSGRRRLQGPSGLHRGVTGARVEDTGHEAQRYRQGAQDRTGFRLSGSGAKGWPRGRVVIWISTTRPACRFRGFALRPALFGRGDVRLGRRSCSPRSLSFCDASVSSSQEVGSNCHSSIQGVRKSPKRARTQHSRPSLVGRSSTSTMTPIAPQRTCAGRYGS
jgi:hypothetical protein